MEDRDEDAGLAAHTQAAKIASLKVAFEKEQEKCKKVTAELRRLREISEDPLAGADLSKDRQQPIPKMRPLVDDKTEDDGPDTKESVARLSKRVTDHVMRSSPASALADASGPEAKAFAFARETELFGGSFA